MKKVVLTGATGFLGFALLTELIRNNVYVYVLCRKNSRRRTRLAGISNVTVIETDPADIEKLDSVSDCDVFYHLAWEGGRNNFTEQYKNVDMSVNCLKLASELGCKRFICTGSQAEYGNAAGVITEDTSLNPVSSYGSCKAAAYHLTADLAKHLSIEHTWVRVFSVYGANDNPNSLIPYLAETLRSNRNAVLRTDGEHMWNYLYEEDMARALYLLGRSPLSDTVYNLASRSAKPLKEFVEELRAAINPGAAVCYGSEKSKVNLDVSTDKLRRSIDEFEQAEFSETIRTIYSQRVSL